MLVQGTCDDKTVTCPVQRIGEDTGGYCYWCPDCGACIDSGGHITFPNGMDDHSPLFGSCEVKEVA